jgi:hypothetical protein
MTIAATTFSAANWRVLLSKRLQFFAAIGIFAANYPFLQQ